MERDCFVNKFFELNLDENEEGGCPRANKCCPGERFILFSTEGSIVEKE